MDHETIVGQKINVYTAIVHYFIGLILNLHSLIDSYPTYKSSHEAI